MAYVCCKVVLAWSVAPLQWPCLGVFFPLFFLLPFWNLLGFFSLTSIAYRRVIRVYQYEVGDDLSGRFFPLYFLTSLWFSNALFNSKARFPSN